MTSESAPDLPLGFARHDHAGCVAQGLAAAEARCAQEGLRLTPARRAALGILLRGHRAMGAYEVLDHLREGGFGAQPPVAYRALDFLVAHGFAHRIERLNAFVACAHPGAEHAPAFLICRLCDRVAEAPDAAPAALAAAHGTGFRVERISVEALGVCPACEDAA